MVLNRVIDYQGVLVDPDRIFGQIVSVHILRSHHSNITLYIAQYTYALLGLFGITAGDGMATQTVVATGKRRFIRDCDPCNLHGRLGAGVLDWRQTQISSTNPYVCHAGVNGWHLGIVVSIVARCTRTYILRKLRYIVAA